MKVDSYKNLGYVQQSAYTRTQNAANPNFSCSLTGITPEIASDTDKLVEFLLKNKNLSKTSV